MYRHLSFLILSLTFACICKAQDSLSLDSCRILALTNNKRLRISHEKIVAAHYEQKAAFTNYLPKLKATGTYLHNTQSVSLLSKHQKQALSALGTTVQNELKYSLTNISGLLPDQLSPLIELLERTDIASPLNLLGQRVNNLLRTDTRNLWGGALTLTQPIYMGGKIRAYHRITKHLYQIAGWEQEQERQSVILSADEAYWQVISLVHKKKLAESFLKLTTTLEEDINKLTEAGIATRADALAVKVKTGEAELALSQANDGLALSRMLLCMLCGLPLDSAICLSDESLQMLSTIPVPPTSYAISTQNRPEIQQLMLATDIYQEKIQLTKSEFLPTIALTGNYLLSNPSLLNGFEKKFRGTWNIGLLVNIPIFHWGEGLNKTKKAQAEARISQYELEEAKELVSLQVRQSVYQLEEAYRSHTISQRNSQRAQENLRIANLGFQEGVISSSQVLEAQTAWLAAQSANIDALINIRIAEANLKRAQGTLTFASKKLISNIQP